MFILKVCQGDQETPLRYKGKVMGFANMDVLEDYLEVAYPNDKVHMVPVPFEGNPRKAYILQERSPRIGGRC